jgi:hypothetical protein
LFDSSNAKINYSMCSIGAWRFNIDSLIMVAFSRVFTPINGFKNSTLFATGSFLNFNVEKMIEHVKRMRILVNLIKKFPRKNQLLPFYVRQLISLVLS